MLGRIHRGAAATIVTLGLLAGAPAAAVLADPGGDHGHHEGIAHVLLISVDGLHQSDLEWYVANHPGSTLAKLDAGGAEYSSAQTPIPSDSFPGMTAQVTGGNPRTAGVYYDDEYSHAVLPAGTSLLPRPADRRRSHLRLAGRSELRTARRGRGPCRSPGEHPRNDRTPTSLLNPATLPVDPHTCKPIYPHEYLKVNTIFEVIHAHGLRTAWSDKHPAYESLEGPAGNSIDDLFTPEIDSLALEEAGGAHYAEGISWTEDNAATMQYDSYKVQAVLNEIDGFNHSRTEHVGVPAILGMNFQTVSTAEKLLKSDGLNGGYEPGTTTPGPLLRRALDYVNTQLQAMVEAIQEQHLSPRPRSSSRRSTASRRRTRTSSTGSRTGRSSKRSTQPGKPRIRAPAT